MVLHSSFAGIAVISFRYFPVHPDVLGPGNRLFFGFFIMNFSVLQAMIGDKKYPLEGGIKSCV